MKVLQINSVCGYGSTGRIAVDLYRVIEKEGHECVIAYGRGKASDELKTIKIGNSFDMYWHVAMTRLFDIHGYASKIATRRLITQIKKYNPDVIHLHNIHGYYINVNILFKYLSSINKPIIWTLHDCWPFTGHCSYFDFAKCDKWKTGCEKCIQKKAYPASLFLDKSKNNYIKKKKYFNMCKNLTIVTPSKWLAGLVNKSFLKYPVEVIPNGIDLTKFKPTNSDLRNKYKLNEKFVILGVASRWDERKGLKSFNELSKKLDDNYRIILIGITEKDKERVNENIITIPRTDSVEQLAEFYSMADVFVNPTTEDNYPTTNLEALACGTPVITYNTGGSIECINSNTGLIIESNTVDELAEKIKKFKKTNYNCLEQSKAYNKEICFKKYLELYNKLIKEEQNEKK